MGVGVEATPPPPPPPHAVTDIISGKATVTINTKRRGIGYPHIRGNSLPNRTFLYP
jgi:hypothetical protein